MLWKVRATLPDRPGMLAVLAGACGDAGVNILGMQVLPAIGEVTDELVLGVPLGWTREDVHGLVAGAGARLVAAWPCGESALVDPATRHLQAARTVLATPRLFTEVVAGLVDAQPGALGDPATHSAEHDVMELVVGQVTVHVWRPAAFTPAEHARGAALADLVTDVWERDRVPAPGAGGPDHEARPAYDVLDAAVVARVDGVEVGRAGLHAALAPGERELVVEVDPAWRRRGIGSRLLVEVARLAGDLGESELVVRTGADNQAVLPLVLGSGLRGRIRMTGEALTVRVPLRDLGAVRTSS